MKTTGFLVIAFAFAVNPAVSFAGLHDPEWNPPARFDHPYDGELTVMKLPQPLLQNVCRQLFPQFGYSDTTHKDQRGCSIPRDGHCLVVTIDKPFNGATPDAVLRHERGHCNGWPANHPD
jgi:hypothetical protein